MEALNETIVYSIFDKLGLLYTLKHETAQLARKRGRQFQSYCELLNSYHVIPDGYCPFYFDAVSCWNATAPHTTARIRCTSWQFVHPNPDGFVERRCKNGRWENVDGEELVSMYKHCQLSDFTVEYGRVVAQLGYAISIACLLLAISVFFYLGKVHCGRNKVHLNLFASMLLRYSLSTVQFVYSYVNLGSAEPIVFITRCRTITTIWNYFLLCSYFWIFVEGLYLHNIIYISVFREPNVWPYAVLGWGVPLVISSFWTIVKIMHDDSRCWLSLDYHLILRVPLLLIILAEVFVAINIARQLYYKLHSDSLSHERRRYRKLAKATLFLIGGTGVNFFIFDVVLAVTGIVSRSAENAHTFYVIINSFWGVAVSFLYCFLSEEIHSDWKLKKAHLKLHKAIKREFECSRIHFLRKTSSIYNQAEDKLQGCGKCTARKGLLKKNGLLKHNESPTGTLCSTAVSSNQNTISASKAPYPPRVSHLSYCREENEDVTSF